MNTTLRQLTDAKRSSHRDISPVVLIDTREKTPFSFDVLPSEVATLSTGDYSIKGIEHIVAVERKSLLDLLACVGRDRARFKRELQRLRAYRFRLLVIETTATDLEAGDWCSQLKPNHVLGSLASWTARYCVPTWLGGDHESSAKFTELYLFQCARHVAEEAQAVQAIEI